MHPGEAGGIGEIAPLQRKRAGRTAIDDPALAQPVESFEHQISDPLLRRAAPEQRETHVHPLLFLDPRLQDIQRQPG